MLHRLRHPKLARVVKKMARLGLADEAFALAQGATEETRGLSATGNKIAAFSGLASAF
jgi:hypothetical protein